MSSLASLHAKSIVVSHGPVLIIDGVDVDVLPGRRIGLVGPNGVGKSTLLRALAGHIALESGRVERAPRTATVGYLPQEPDRSDTERVTDFIARRTGVTAATLELEEATTALASGESGSDDRYADAFDRWLALGAADLDSRLGAVCDDLGIVSRVLEQPMSSLSGGEAARVGLAALLLARFDVYLLDEPTNDLDLAGLKRLEDWVNEQQAGVVIVSHDREFLRRTVTHVLEFDAYKHRVSLFAGGWDAFLVERDVAAQHAQERYDDYVDKRSSLLDRAQREREWATQGLRRAKKAPDDNDKNAKAFKINQSEQLAGKAARTERAMERLEQVEAPREAWELRLTFGEVARSGDLAFALDEAMVSKGDFALGPITLAIGSGERVAIVGHNGSGKSTLLETLLGRVELVSGTRRIGPGVVVGELEQRRLQFTDDTTLLEGFMAQTGMTVPDARTLLAKFGIGAGEVHRAAATLSPGERTRAVLALLMANGTNCLVLDEPTNHLDMPAIEQLETALEAFRGTVLLVTHDRSLLETVRLTRTIRLDGGRIVDDRPTGD